MGPQRWRAATSATVALVLASLVGGCGGSSKSSATRATTTAPVTADTTVTTAPNYSGKDSAEFCALAATYPAKLQQLAAKVSDPSQLEPYLKELSNDVDEAVSVAPAEIKADMQLVARAVDGFVAAAARADYHFERVPADASARLQAPDVQAASARLSAYGSKVCGTKS